MLEAIPEVREWLGGPPSGPGVDGRLSRRAGCGREAICGWPEGVTEPSWRAGRVQKALQEGQDMSGDPPGGKGVVLRLSWLAKSGPEPLPRGAEMIRRPSRLAKIGWEPLLEGWKWARVGPTTPCGGEWSGGPPEKPGVVGRLPWRARSS